MNLTEEQYVNRRKLKKFGLTMFGALAVLAVLLLLRQRSAWPWLAGCSSLFLLSALVKPGILAPVEKVWMGFAGVLGFVMTNVLLTLVFFIGVMPTGLLMRLFGKDPIRKGFKKNSGSYWIDVRNDGPGGRPDKPY